MIPQPKKAKEEFKLDKKEVNIKKEANKEETLIAKSVGGKKTIRSGGILFDPSDIKLGDSIIEVKSALKQKQIIVKEEMLDKLLRESLRVNKKPMMILNFPKSDLRIKKWVLVPYE